MNYLVPPEAPDHLPLATLPCGKNFSRKSSTRWWSIEPAIPWKYFKTDTCPSWWHAEGSALPSVISRQGSALRSTSRGVLICLHLDLQVLRTGLWGNSCCCWIGSVWGTKHKREGKRVHPVNSVTRLQRFCQLLTNRKFGSTVSMCLSAKVVAKS